MHTHRAIFNLKGNNIILPSPKKVKKTNKLFTHLHDQLEQHSNEVQLLVGPKDTFPLRKIPSRSSNYHSTHPETESPQLISSLCPQLPVKTQHEPLYVSDSKITTQQQSISPLRKGRQHYSSMKGKRCACGDCPECLKDFPYFLRLFSDNQNLPQVSAKSWCVWRKKKGRYMHYYGKRIHKVREIASLTKMITCLVAIQFLEKHNYDPQKVTYHIRKTSTAIGGTTANLQEGQLCNLLQLFYGMMLPSGNDAAIAMSEVIGLLSYLKGKGRQIQPYNEGWDCAFSKNYSHLFIGMMNERCQRIGTMDTKCNNSHGNDPYDYYKNVSTCHQIARIASQFMQNAFLRTIVSTPKWGPYENTNKLLEDGFDGIKTGITETAGPCLAASYKDIIIVVLNSKSMNERWLQVKKLVKWILNKN